MWTNPVFILAAVGLVLAVVSYWSPQTLGAAVILIAVAILIGVAKAMPH